MTGKMLARRRFDSECERERESDGYSHKKSAVNFKFLNQTAILRENNEKVLKFNLIKQFHRAFSEGGLCVNNVTLVFNPEVLSKL